MAGLAGYSERRKAAKDARKQEREERFKQGQVLTQLAQAQAQAQATALQRQEMTQYRRDTLEQRREAANMRYQTAMARVNKPPASAYPKAPQTKQEFVADMVKEGYPVAEARKMYAEIHTPSVPPPPPGAYTGD